MQVKDRQTIRKFSVIGYSLAVLSFLILPDISFGQQQASEPSPLIENISSNTFENTAVVKPLWGGPTSFDSVSHVTTSKSSTPLHHFDLPCESCHNSSIPGGNGILESDVDVNRSCTLSGCHEYDSTLNHPIDTPVTLVGENLSLDSSERLTCLACHDREGSNTQYDSLDERSLQIPNGNVLCSSCHSEMSGTLKQRSHWQFSTNAHLGSINPNGSSHKNEYAGILDSESQKCLSCHENVSASIAGSPTIDGMNTMSNHPIGMDYSHVVNKKYTRTKYNRLSTNTRHLRLFDGKMGCGTCHSPYSNIKKNLVQDNYGSRLCLECHNM